MIARLRDWWRARGWWGLSPYVDGDGQDRPEPPDRGPQPRDLARVRVIEARAEAVRLRARLDRELREFEHDLGGGP